MLNRRKHHNGDQEDSDEEFLLGSPSLEVSIASHLTSDTNPSTSLRFDPSRTSSPPTYGQHNSQQESSLATSWNNSSHQEPSYQLKSRASIYNNNIYNSSREASIRDKIQGDSCFHRNDTGAIELSIGSHQRHRNSQASDFIYYVVQPGDTLQNLSVRYSCSIAAIKRLNNLWSDQEFYALSKVKLPVGKFRLIADVLEPETLQPPDSRTIPTCSDFQNFQPPPGAVLNNSTAQNGSNVTSYVTNQDFDQSDHRLVADCNSQTISSTSSSDSIFKIYDINIEKARVAAQSYDDHASAIMESLAQSGNMVAGEDNDLSEPLRIARREAETLLNDMSDYGLSYNGLILFIFIVCLICPLAYIIYLEETHKELTNKSH